MFYWWIALTTLVVVFVGVTAFKFFVEAPLVNMTRENFQDGPYKFLMFSVDWCPHCHHAKPEFEKLGSTMTIGGKPVALNAIEAEKNPDAVQGLKISGYPTFVLYDAEGNMVKDYDGPRKTASFRSFLEDTMNMKAQRMSK